MQNGCVEDWVWNVCGMCVGCVWDVCGMCVMVWVCRNIVSRTCVECVSLSVERVSWCVEWVCVGIFE